jgi:hypothetical protein
MNTQIPQRFSVTLIVLLSTLYSFTTLVVNPGITEIPFTYTNGLIFFKVGFNNNTTHLNFMLDSGAPTFIRENIMQAMQSSPFQTSVAYDVTGAEYNVELHRVDRLHIRDFCFRDVEIISGNHTNQMPILSSGLADGLVGINMMREAIWMIDYEKQKIAITRSLDSLNINGTYYTAPIRFDEYGSPVITLKLADNTRINAVLDVGYNGALLLQPTYFTDQNESRDSINVLSKTEISSGFSHYDGEQKTHTLKNVRIGNLFIENVKATEMGDITMNLIGNAFLKQFRVVFDFIHNELILIPLNKEEMPTNKETAKGLKM